MGKVHVLFQVQITYFYYWCKFISENCSLNRAVLGRNQSHVTKYQCTVMAKSFQPVVVSRSYKDWNSAGPVKVLADLNNFGPKLFGLFFNITDSRHTFSFLLPC